MCLDVSLNRECHRMCVSVSGNVCECFKECVCVRELCECVTECEEMCLILCWKAVCILCDCDLGRVSVVSDHV